MRRGLFEAVGVLSGAFGRGVFPHQFSFVLQLPGRQLLLSPSGLAARLPLSPTCRGLEIGAGSGYYSARVGLECRRLVLIDLQPAMLRKAIVRAASVERLDAIAADAASIPLASQSLDLVYMTAVFGEVSRPEEMLTEINRVLVQSGVLSISEHLPDPDFSTFSAVQQLVESHGFELITRLGRPWSYTANFRKR